MSFDDFDDGLIHSHNWAAEAAPFHGGSHPQVADASMLTTPSSVVHDDLVEMGLA